MEEEKEQNAKEKENDSRNEFFGTWNGVWNVKGGNLSADIREYNHWSPSDFARVKKRHQLITNSRQQWQTVLKKKKKSTNQQTLSQPVKS